jgi:hypothetical protein
MKSAIMALRHGGRVSLMGGIHGDVAIPHSRVMHWGYALGFGVEGEVDVF